ncbi:RRP12-like protein [Quillaja saponaria]|uniref:RRP12-like protein n=1 Tax=Quillaja saponaria TaxID=32244 RepID=A0AAD7Q8D0_QUISA|nr:RRP12-like protein [Quillaja saponaria]
MEELQEDHTESFKDGLDLCQQLMDRYTKSAATQHRHLLATAAAMRLILTDESLPLTPPAYFAAAISSLDTAAASETLDPIAVSSLLSFMSVGLPLVVPGGIVPLKANEAVGVLVRLLLRERQELAALSVRAAVKCLGILLGFCDVEDWGSVKLGFETLLKFSVDKRPKVRRCAQDYLEKFFKSLHCSTVVKEASNLVLSMVRSYKPWITTLITDGPKDDVLSKPEHLEVLHMLNVLKLTAPHLSVKVISKVSSEINKSMSSQFSALTRHIHKTIEAIFEASKIEDIVTETENIIVSLASYVSLGDQNPLDTVMCAMALLKRALDMLHAGNMSSSIMNLPLVCGSAVGLLYHEASTASQASSILKEVLCHLVDHKSLSVGEDQPSNGGSLESPEASSIKSTCSIFENALSAGDGVPNEHILAVISVLFLKLGDISYIIMKNIVLKLAEFMIHASGGTLNTEHLHKCIGSAVIAMGPERLLTLLPISLDDHNFTCSNIWLVPILKDYVAGASLGYYMDHIMPLAKSFKRASRKVKQSTVSENLLAQYHELCGLLPSFCRYPTDTCQKCVPLVDVLIIFLMKEPLMHENVSIALQVLVGENKSVLSPKKDAGESNSFGAKYPELAFGNMPSYTKKTATKNVKALASCSSLLLQTLADLFISSLPEKRSILKDAIGCLASITDSSMKKMVLVSLLKRFQFIGGGSEVEKFFSHNQASANKEQGDLSNMERDSQRYLILELTSSLVEGAKSDLIDIIYNLVTDSLRATNVSGHREAYQTLNRILEEHSWFCSSRFKELADLLLGLEAPIDIVSLRSRFASFHTLMVHAMKTSSEEENSKAFLILNEIILTLKDGSDKPRKTAYDTLLDISSSLQDSSCDTSDAPYHKLISMIMGYLSGSSPHIKSGAVSALSILVYKDTNICQSVPDLVPSLLSLLQTKAAEVIKAVLGFLKVVASSVSANDLQNLLSDVVNEVMPWSSVSRNHFRSKVIVILEILTRKCGSAAVKSVTPDKYKSFIKTVLENRHNKGRSEEADSTGTEKNSRRFICQGVRF